MLPFVPALSLVVALSGAAGTAPSAEVTRLRAHFDGALEMLAARPLTGLTADQRARRAALTDELRAYRDRGRFPNNYDFRAPTPYFVDRKTGVLCAVANLMEHTGKRALVDAVAAADNNVWVAELAGNAEFNAWLDENGLTLAEAARIQAPYVGDGPTVVAEPRAPSNPNLTAGLATSALTLGLVNFVPQLKSTRTGAALAFAAGTFATTTAAGSFRGSNDRHVATLALASGLLNYYVSGRTVGRFRAAERARRTNLSPILPTSREQGAGVMLSITF